MREKKILPNIMLTNQLTDYVKSETIKTQKDFERVIEDLYIYCDKFLARNKKPGMKNRQIRKILAVIYASWDTMVERLRSEKYLVTNMIQEGSYKTMLELQAKQKGLIK